MLQRFESFVTGITVCYKYLQKIKSVEMTELGLKGTHAMCIFFVAHETEPLTATRLCQLCAEDKAAISRNLNVLQKLGYIEPTDKKYRAHLQLTERGKEVAVLIDQMIADWVSRGGDGLSDEERISFYNSLSHIAYNLKHNFGKKYSQNGGIITLDNNNDDAQ